MQKKTSRKFLVFLLLGISLFPSAFADINIKTNPDNQLKAWIVKEGNLELKIAQILPDKNRAFFIARGFPKAISDKLATSCLMQTVVKNTASDKNADAITVKLKDWQIKPFDKNTEELQGLKLKETWNTEWGKDAIPPAARIAFRWATFPSEQTFEPAGDYNWGINSFNLPPKSQFDLNIVWYEGDTKKNTWIHKLQCAEDK